MMGFLQKSSLSLLLLVVNGSAFAGACTYGEAIMALEQGNTVRGLALMRMANRDGDERASRYFVEMERDVRDGRSELATSANYLSQKTRLSLNRVNP